MTWDAVLELGPTVIARTLGCSVTTASSWINRSGPPEWQKAKFLPYFETEKPALSAGRRTPKAKP